MQISIQIQKLAAHQLRNGTPHVGPMKSIQRLILHQAYSYNMLLLLSNTFGTLRFEALTMASKNNVGF
jgi:hypothetical protein